MYNTFSTLHRTGIELKIKAIVTKPAEAKVQSHCHASIFTQELRTTLNSARVG
jgi:hypothetical protein